MQYKTIEILEIKMNINLLLEKTRPTSDDTC